jgi:hypothetical protein
VLFQPVSTDDYLTKAFWKLADQIEQSFLDQFPLQFPIRVWYYPRFWYLYPDIGVSTQFFDPTMNMAADSHPGIGRKGCSPPGIISLDRSPQSLSPVRPKYRADPTCLHRFLIWNITSSLAPNEGVHQPFVLLHCLLHGLRFQSFACTFVHEIPPFF